MNNEKSRSQTPPQLRPGYLFAAAVIWAAVIAAWLAPPAEQVVRLAKLECAPAR